MKRLLIFSLLLLTTKLFAQSYKIDSDKMDSNMMRWNCPEIEHYQDLIASLHNEDVKILIKAENNKYDPAGLYRIVKFYESKKERRIQWLQFEDGVIDEDAKKKGYIPFTAQKFGVQSYLLTIPASELEEGEYGIIYMGVETATMIPVGTFGIH